MPYAQNMHMTYFNYHAKAKKLINSGYCFACSIFSTYKHISPALVLYFSNSKPMPIREYMWHEYLPLLKDFNIPIQNNENISLE